MKEQSRTKMLAHDIPLRFVKLLNVILMTIPGAGMGTMSDRWKTASIKKETC